MEQIIMNNQNNWNNVAKWEMVCECVMFVVKVAEIKNMEINNNNNKKEEE